MDEELVWTIEKRIGMVKEIDLGATRDCLGKFIRARVEVNVTNPLERRFTIDLDDPYTKPIPQTQNDLIPNPIPT